ncbi:hypothetical protein [Acinetobacter populi]|uniref:Uncharacterized protein n=1 Tax=Acinetobacter populi TaxID=1582270 RepID=A0A1Z9Z2T4_9GAMM|nr:hypothetical protein [Acinetobacter populi]OUY08774.1 hypothetical protein CAP51_03935 [Acinetobacter populi]
MSSTGGTKIYCPICKKIKVCKAIPVTYITYDTKDYTQQMQIIGHPDIQFFQRGRMCTSCNHEFITAEIEYDFLNELCELRSALRKIKENAREYSTQTEVAQKTLKNLQISLEVLSALE